MKVLPTGDFVAEPSEEITFKVTRKNTPCKASFDCQGWADGGQVIDLDDHTKQKTCKATANEGDEQSCAIVVGFREDAQGTFDPSDQYTVQITGSKGGGFNDKFTPPPVQNGSTYDFTVEKAAE